MNKIVTTVFCSLLSLSLFGATQKLPTAGNKSNGYSFSKQQKILLDDFRNNYKNNKKILSLKNKTLSLKGLSVPVLIEVMKSSRFPDKNRWVATFLLGQIAGKKSSPFIAKFTEHPNWVLRLASLKTLLKLKETRYLDAFKSSLKDKSMIIRSQALDAVQILQITSLGPYVWSMLYDKKNYKAGKGKNKRASIIKKVIRTIGNIGYKKAEPVLLSMIQKKQYRDIFSEMNYSLELLSGKKSPEGASEVKKIFWNKYMLASTTI